jgi:hypothetical protein
MGKLLVILELLFRYVRDSAAPFPGPPPIIDIIPNSFCIFNKNLATKRHKKHKDTKGFASIGE